MIDLGPPVLVWRDDPLFNQGHIAAELALGVLQTLEREVAIGEHDADAAHAIERLETFLEGARKEAAERAEKTGHDRHDAEERVALAIWESMDVTDGLTEWVAKKYARAAIEAYERAAPNPCASTSSPSDTV